MAEIVERVEQKTWREKVTSRVCDICAKTVDPTNYFHITTSHMDWGNDSIDSIDHYDACSPKCVFEFTNDYVNGAFENKYNTRKIDIEHMRHL